MAKGLRLGFRFSAQIWNFFVNTFKKDPRKLTKRQALSLLKKSAIKDKRLAKVMLTKEGKASKFWRTSSFWSQMKKNLQGVSVRYSKNKKPYLTFKWTPAETAKIRMHKSPKKAYEALGEIDSPHSYNAVASKMRRMKIKGEL